MVSEHKFLSIALVTRRKGNRFSTMHNADDRDESVHDDQGTTKGDNEEVQLVIRIQTEDLTAQLAESGLYNRCRHQTPPQQAKKEDEDEDSYGSANPFAEHRTQRRRPPVQAHAN